MATAFVILIALNVLDYWATAQLIARDGMIVEANPLLYHWITVMDSTLPILFAKLFALAFLAFMLVYFRHKLLHRQKIIRNAIWGLNVVVGAACVIGVLMLHDIPL